MRYHARFATSVAILALLLISARARGQDSIYEVPPEPTVEGQDSFESFAEEVLAEDRIFEPTIDITAEGFVGSVPRTAWSAGVDLVAFQPSFGEVDFNDNGEDGYSVAPRLFVNWESESGFGVRGRLWGFEAEGRVDSFPSGGFSTLRGFDFRGVSPVDAISTDPFELRAGSLDIDFYKRFGEGKTSLVLGAGLKSAALQYERPALSEDTIAGAGVGLLGELRHVLYQNDDSEVALVGSGRVGFLIGERRNETTRTSFGDNTGSSFETKTGLLVLPATTSTEEHQSIEEHHTNMTISEAALGLEWKHDLGWSVLTLRGQYEAQFWDTDGSNDLSFNGGAVRAGLSW